MKMGSASENGPALDRFHAAKSESIGFGEEPALDRRWLLRVNGGGVSSAIRPGAAENNFFWQESRTKKKALQREPEGLDRERS